MSDEATGVRPHRWAEGRLALLDQRRLAHDEIWRPMDGPAVTAAAIRNSGIASPLFGPGPRRALGVSA